MKKNQNRVSTLLLGRQSWISDQNDFSYSRSHPDTSYQVSSQLVFRFRRRSAAKIDFQDGRHGFLGFPIGTVLAIFDLQVTMILSSKFRVRWPFGSEDKVQNRLSGWPPCSHF